MVREGASWWNVDKASKCWRTAVTRTVVHLEMGRGRDRSVQRTAKMYKSCSAVRGDCTFGRGAEIQKPAARG